jgi:hypothetical protein
MRSVFEILLLFLFIALAVAVLLILLLGPQYADDIVVPEKKEQPKKQLTTDWIRYFQLKNTSCKTLSGNFLIVTDDTANGSMAGLVESVIGEREAAERILSGYSSNQTTKTYVRGEWMKKVVISGGNENTTIWKEGRIYECNGNCTMRLMSENESSEYYNNLYRIKSGCAYFGKTSPPVDLGSLITLNRTGILNMRGYRCENFLISANRTYAKHLLTNGTLDTEQRTLLWAIAHLDKPLQECLDESTGIIVYRNITLDLTDAYLFDYNPGGYMKVNQQTNLTYFTDNVPESFLGLPQN